MGIAITFWFVMAAAALDSRPNLSGHITSEQGRTCDRSHCVYRHCRRSDGLQPILPVVLCRLRPSQYHRCPGAP